VIVTVGSIRGAPGATSWSLLLGAAWPQTFAERRIVLEADPVGGVLGARYGLGVEPGVVRLVTGIRRNGTPAIDVDPVARQLDASLLAVPGPEAAETALAVWSEGAAPVASRLARERAAWFVDVGRLDNSNPSAVFADHAALNLLVVRPNNEHLVQLPSKVSWLHRRTAPVGVIVSGKCSFGVDEVSEFSGADAVWMVPTRDDLAEEVGRVIGGTRGRRSWLWRHALDVAADAFALVSSRVPGLSEVTA
jgi:hypothetical protein